jgi:acetyl-CoA carboxylase biotin carboxyl carrier protein
MLKRLINKKQMTKKKKIQSQPNTGTKNSPSKEIFDLSLIQDYSDFMQKNGLAEIDIQWGEKSLRLKKILTGPNVQAVSGLNTHTPSVMAQGSQPSASSNGSHAHHSVVESHKKTHIVTSPFVGTFYRSPGPNQDAFVEEGKTVHTGDTLCIVEAMKLMNEIESDVKGRVVRTLIPDGTPVEFGEPLFEIEPV